MKKIATLLTIFTCVALLLAVPVFAEKMDHSSTTNNYGTKSSGTYGSSMNGTGQYGTRSYDNNNGTMNSYGTNPVKNTYRAAAAADDDFDWGWLGLLGLIGLAGLKGRDRERT
ncbi:WGxxGxxG family protein [Paenibacillus sp. GCM10023252]|uniref:WGxxGxxG family protein n=1 Tax=Paenibacillus sp. GCM10023252 TaxID=3252649 RepID=UPI003612933D